MMHRPHTRLRNTPFARTIPRSRPMVKLIKTSVSRPTMVVSELEAMARAPFTSVLRMASSQSSVERRSWRYRLISMMA